MSMSLIHILPETAADYQEYLTQKIKNGEDHIDEHFAIPYIMLITGFCMMLFLDQVLFKTSSNSHPHIHEDHEDSEEEHC